LAGVLALFVVFATAPGAVASAGGHPTATSTTAATTTTTSPPPPPEIVTSHFVCSNGTCAIGPGNVAMPFAAGLVGTGGPPYGGPECNSYLMSVVSGSLPPGLQLGEPVCEWVISGTPAKAGTYSFTVEITPQPDGFGNPRGPNGFQQFNITIGAGSADRLLVLGATWYPTKYTLQIGGFDVNNGVTYTILTPAGAVLATLTERTPVNGGDGTFGFSQHRQNAAGLNPLTVTDSLGSTVTVPVVVKLTTY
jgi:hypothetical protein